MSTTKVMLISEGKVYLTDIETTKKTNLALEIHNLCLQKSIDINCTWEILPTDWESSNIKALSPQGEYRPFIYACAELSCTCCSATTSQGCSLRFKEAIPIKYQQIHKDYPEQLKKFLKDKQLPYDTGPH